MSSLDYLDLCRLCLVKDRVSVPIFDGEGDVRQIFLKIAACLPVKVAREDKLPKKICDDCVYKVELFYQFWNTTANAEKQLLQWLGDVGLEEKQGYVSEVLSSEIMKQEESENRLDVSVMQATGEHTNNMAINMIDEMNLGIPIIMSTDQQITVPISSSNNVQTGQSVPGPSTRSRQNQVTPKSAIHDAEEDTSEDDNSDDDCDADDGLAVKEEGEDATSGNRAIEPTTFVNVALACDEAGPSGLQQQKLVDMPAMGMQQSSEGDSKSGSDYFVGKQKKKVMRGFPEFFNDKSIYGPYLSGRYFVSKLAMLSQTQCNVGEMKVLCDGSTELVLTESLQVPKTENEIIVPADSFIQCALCGDAFICEEELAMHLKTHDHVQPRQHHQEIVEEIIGEQDDEDEMEEEDEEEEDEEEEVLEEDMVETLEEEEEEDEEGEEENEKVVYVCEHCGRSFNTTVLLRKHQQQVHNTPDKFYVCEICGYSSPHKQNLINHQRRHNLEYKYRCEVCGAGFYARNIYQEHQLVHSREKPFQCEICNATFRYRQGLRLHAKLHQPDYIPPQKKHLCELCNKRFSRKQVLLVHMRTHGNGGPQNEYICHICGKAVSSKTYLTVHVRKHTGEKPHVCDLCGKGFISQNYLSVHRRTHTGERPHKCTHCDKRFTQRTTLVVHLRGHTGDRPYPCTFCHKSFASKTMLNSHLKTHAKQNARAQMEQQQQHDRHYQQEINPEHLNHEQLEIQDTLHVDELQQSEMHQDELQDQSHVRTLENVTILLPS